MLVASSSSCLVAAGQGIPRGTRPAGRRLSPTRFSLLREAGRDEGRFVIDRVRGGPLHPASIQRRLADGCRHVGLAPTQGGKVMTVAAMRACASAFAQSLVDSPDEHDDAQIPWNDFFEVFAARRDE